MTQNAVTETDLKSLELIVLHFVIKS